MKCVAADEAIDSREERQAKAMSQQAFYEATSSDDEVDDESEVEMSNDKGGRV